MSWEQQKGWGFSGQTIKYKEYGAGAEIVTADGGVIADFPSHLQAESFLEALDLLRELFKLTNPLMERDERALHRCRLRVEKIISNSSD